jgi:DNA polymerase I-like protein with 3'-5' exonuclease and polymerase domains
LGVKGTSFEQLCGKGVHQIGFDEVDLERATHYACEDADFTLRLHHVLRPEVRALDSLEYIYQLEILVSRVLFEIECNGVMIDSAELGRQSHVIGQELLTLEQRAYTIAEQPFNLNSPKQLGEILFTKMQLPVVRKTPGGAPSTDEDVLTKLAEDYPLPQVLLEYRGLAKLKSTYTDKLPKMVNAATGRVHTHYAQAAVITGRLASSEPDLQNIPVRSEAGRRVREACGVALAEAHGSCGNEHDAAAVHTPDGGKDERVVHGKIVTTKQEQARSEHQTRAQNPKPLTPKHTSHPQTPAPQTYERRSCTTQASMLEDNTCLGFRV